MLQEGLVALLAADSGVGAILGQRPDPPDGMEKGNGIFPNDLPEGAPLPAIVYADIHAANEMTFDGPEIFTTARIEFACRGSKYGDAKRLARAVRICLENFTGTLADEDQTEVDSMRRISEVDLFEFAPFEHRTVVDFEIAFRDTGALAGFGDDAFGDVDFGDS